MSIPTFEPVRASGGDMCDACLTPYTSATKNEEWCRDQQGRLLCESCGVDERVLPERSLLHDGDILAPA
jgi:hypothetical protein